MRNVRVDTTAPTHSRRTADGRNNEGKEDRAVCRNAFCRRNRVRVPLPAGHEEDRRCDGEEDSRRQVTANAEHVAQLARRRARASGLHENQAPFGSCPPRATGATAGTSLRASREPGALRLMPASAPGTPAVAPATRPF